MIPVLEYWLTEYQSEGGEDREIFPDTKTTIFTWSVQTDHIAAKFVKVVFHNFTWSILEYFVSI